MATVITRELIDRITGNHSDRWLEPVRDATEAWDISTKKRVSMFLATCAHESAAFRRLQENMKYSAKALRRVWEHRFSVADAERMAYDEYAIAERAYGGRYGNRPEGEGDGYLYRGGGLIQLTFYDNYLVMGEHLGVDLTQEPELLQEPLWAAFASAVYWDVHGCNEAADKDDFEAATRIVNPAKLGWEDRKNWLKVVQGAM